MTIAVDFDGTCVTHEYPHIGASIGAERVLHKLVSAGHKLILFTMRSGEPLKDAINWFAERKIDLYGINVNPEQHHWTQSPKVYAHIYIDDAALGCPVHDAVKVNEKLILHERLFVNWDAVERILIAKGLLSIDLFSNFEHG